MDNMLTVQQVALRLNVSQTSVYRWLRAGKLPAVKLGHRQVRIKEADLEAFIRARAIAPAQPVEEETTEDMGGEHAPNAGTSG